MKPLAIALAALLFFGILTIWVPELWAWSAVQCGIFLIAALRLLERDPIELRIIYLPLTMAGVWPMLQVATGHTLARPETWMAVLTWETFLVIFLLACELLTEAKALIWFLKIVSLGGSLLAVLSIAQDYSSPGKIFWIFPSGYAADVLGPFVNRNQFAAWLELLVPVTLYLAVTDRRFVVLYGTGAAIMISSVIASGSRAGSFLVVAESVGVMLLFIARNNFPRKAMVIRSVQLAGLASIAIAVVGSETLRTRLESFGPEPLRMDALKASMQMTADHPWLGIGLGAWSTVYPRYATIDTGVFMNQAHNDWIQWAAEGGIPFVLLLAILATMLWKPAFRSIYGLGIISFLAHAFLDYPMQQRPVLACWFFAIAGATVAESSLRSRVTGSIPGQRTF